jgi:hypothetical protein
LHFTGAPLEPEHQLQPDPRPRPFANLLPASYMRLAACRIVRPWFDASAPQESLAMIPDACKHIAALDEDDCIVSPGDETEVARQHDRSEFHEIATATIYPPAGDTQQPLHCPVLTRDLSAAGFGIVLTRPLQPRQRIELTAAQRRFVGEIVWCREAEFGFYIAGCRLLASECCSQTGPAA